jgi:hypothetical protein
MPSATAAFTQVVGQDTLICEPQARNSNLLPGEGEGAGAVAVGAVLGQVGQAAHPELNDAALGVRGVLAGEDGLAEGGELGAEEDADDRRRRLVGPEAEVVAVAGDARPQQVGVAVDAEHGRGEESQEARVLRRVPGRLEQVVARVGLHRPVDVLARAIDASEGLLVQQAGEAVALGHPAQQLHHQLVVVGGHVRLAVEHRDLELAGGDLVVAGLGRHADLVELVLKLVHKSLDPARDRAEVVVLEHLALRRRGAEHRAAGDDEVGAQGDQGAVDQEVLLLGAGGHNDALDVVFAQIVAEGGGLLADRAHRAQQRGLLVQRGAGIRDEDAGNAERGAALALHDEHGRGGVPGGVAAGLKGRPHAAAGEGAGVGLGLDELAAAELGDGALVVEGQERVVFLGRRAGHRLEPVAEVGHTPGLAPVVDHRGDAGGQIAVEAGALGDGALKTPEDVAGQVLSHLLDPKDIGAEQLAHRDRATLPVEGARVGADSALRGRLDGLESGEAWRHRAGLQHGRDRVRGPGRRAQARR